ncbi:C2H2 type zinc finger protein [Phytophthora infestans]|uniref:C2H2 type zinc finger n=1 Tax=Phytophthora infestans TaxID=4787 RepID=A0A833S9M3_PHYIN|nr:C2H2 type zinc finger protein [Phytophthora infestans]KAF4149408.1 C2H2 type zinc finger [Phytophthora infestans]
MAPLALSSKVDAMSLGGHGSLSSAQNLPPVAKTEANSVPTTSTKPKSVETKRATKDKTIFRCTFPGCGREFQLKGNLKRHVNIHNGDKKFACKFCGKKFLRKADMEVHYRVHTGEKPYRCKYEECGKCFARRSDLLSHERTHTGRKPFSCAFPGCDRSFARKFDLHKHQRLHEDQTDASGRPRTKKRKLSPVVAKKIDSGDESCDCPSDVANALVTTADTAMNPDVLLPEPFVMKAPLPITTTCRTNRRKMSATAACLDTPTRPIRYELKCPENHIHSPPACLAALSSLDAFLLSQETLPFSLDAFPPHCPSTTIGTSCCPAHLELRPPPPDDITVSTTGNKVSSGSDMLEQLLTPLPPSSALPNGIGNSSMGPTFPEDPTLTFIAPDATGSAFAPVNQLSSSGNAAHGAASGSDTPAAPAKSASEKACVSTPTSLLQYSRHNRSCGHLSIQHGNHRDYVVQNHLVCQNSVTNLGALQRGPAKTAAKTEPTQPAKCSSPRDAHRPGCGHLPVRHNDHIDYVVEDNLICQQASWLQDDNLELLGDDFWDFYGAIDAFPTK